MSVQRTCYHLTSPLVELYLLCNKKNPKEMSASKFSRQCCLKRAPTFHKKKEGVIGVVHNSIAKHKVRRLCLPNLVHAGLKTPCPFRSWIRKQSISPRFQFNHAPNMPMSHAVHPPLVSFYQESCKSYIMKQFWCSRETIWRGAILFSLAVRPRRPLPNQIWSQQQAFVRRIVLHVSSKDLGKILPKRINLFKP